MELMRAQNKGLHERRKGEIALCVCAVTALKAVAAVKSVDCFFVWIKAYEPMA